MANEFQIKDLSGMIDNEFLLIVLGAEHETHVAERNKTGRIH